MASKHRPSSCAAACLGTLLANIGNMPDMKLSATKNVPKKKKEWLIITFGLLTVIGIFLWLRSESSINASDGAEPTVALETFVVNLSGSGQRAYLRVGITLGLAHSLPHNQPEVLPTALVRDTVLSVLATAQPGELLNAEGKRQLKDELLKALQQRVPKLAIENVYFTEFLVQM
jgi:flagellar basal body-associated protein FliL